MLATLVLVRISQFILFLSFCYIILICIIFLLNESNKRGLSLSLKKMSVFGVVLSGGSQ